MVRTVTINKTIHRTLSVSSCYTVNLRLNPGSAFHQLKPSLELVIFCNLLWLVLLKLTRHFKDP